MNHSGQVLHIYPRRRGSAARGPFVALQVLHKVMKELPEASGISFSFAVANCWCYNQLSMPFVFFFFFFLCSPCKSFLSQIFDLLFGYFFVVLWKFLTNGKELWRSFFRNGFLDWEKQRDQGSGDSRSPKRRMIWHEVQGDAEFHQIMRAYVSPVCSMCCVSAKCKFCVSSFCHLGQRIWLLFSGSLTRKQSRSRFWKLFFHITLHLVAFSASLHLCM